MIKKIILIISIVVFISTGIAFAGNKPVSLKTTTPVDGAEAVAVDVAIILEFSNNVVNMTVAENNRECFTLNDSQGTAIELDVYLPDDQLEPENKRTITLNPVEPLKPASTYTVIISGDLLSKNGNSLGEELTFSFKTSE